MQNIAFPVHKKWRAFPDILQVAESIDILDFCLFHVKKMLLSTQNLW